MDNIPTESTIPVAPPRRPKWVKVVLGIFLCLAAAGTAMWLLRTLTMERGEGAVSTPLPMTPQPAGGLFPDDVDQDGVSDREELSRGTSNREFDSDYDGLSDADELNTWQTDPTKADTDNDGFSDAIEVIRGFNPRGSGTLP